VPIFGARGLNNGLADPMNIGWELGWVLAGRAGPALLDSYTPERRGATLDEFANASKSARFMTPPRHGWQVMRDAALSLDHDFAGHLANPRQMTPYVYAESAVVRADDPGFAGGAAAGDVLPDAPFGGGFLSDRMGPGFAVLCFDSGLARALGGVAGEGLRVLLLPPTSDPARRLAAGAGSACLLRPDLYIAARWHRARAEHVIAAYRAAICKRAE